RRVGALIPDDLERVSPNFGRPKARRKNCNARRHLNHVLDAGNSLGLVRLEALYFAAEHGGSLDDRDEHTGYVDVDSEEALAGGLFRNIKTFHRLSDDSECHGVF